MTGMNRSSILDTQDVVFLRDIHLIASIGLDAWHRPNRKQPVVVSLEVSTSITVAGNMDDVSKTIHYGNLCKSVMKAVEQNNTYESLRAFTYAIAEVALLHSNRNALVELTTTLPEALLLADGFGMRSRVLRLTDSSEPPLSLRVEHESFFIQGLRLSCVLGVNPHERLEKQPVVFNMDFLEMRDIYFGNYAELVKRVVDAVEISSFETLEALVLMIARLVCDFAVPAITVSAEKPRALIFVDGAGVRITRRREQLLHGDSNS